MTKEEEDEAFLASIRLDPEAHAQALARKDATADPLAKVVKATKQQRPREVEPFLLAGVKSFARGVKVLDGPRSWPPGPSSCTAGGLCSPSRSR